MPFFCFFVLQGGQEEEGGQVSGHEGRGCGHEARGCGHEARGRGHEGSRMWYGEVTRGEIAEKGQGGGGRGRGGNVTRVVCEGVLDSE